MNPVACGSMVQVQVKAPGLVAAGAAVSTGRYRATRKATRRKKKLWMAAEGNESK